MTEFGDWLNNNWIDLARLGVQVAILGSVVRYGGRLLMTLRASQEQIGALLKLSVAEGVAEQRSSQHEEVQRAAQRGAEPEAAIDREPFAQPRSAREAELAREIARHRVAITEPEPEPEPVMAREAHPPMWDREPEPAFVGPASMRESAMRGGYAEREQSLGGRVLGSISGTPAAVLDPPIAHNEPMSRGESPVPRSEVRPFTPWVSAPSTVPGAGLNVAAAVAVRREAGVQSWLNAPMRSSGPGPIKRMVRWLQTPAGSRPRPAR